MGVDSIGGGLRMKILCCESGPHNHGAMRRGAANNGRRPGLCRIMALAALGAYGCARTTISFPVAGGTATYDSTRDTDVGGLEVIVKQHPDGVIETKIKLESGSGTASTVDAIAWAGVGQLADILAQWSLQMRGLPAP